jgi:protein HIRA/HIR1
MLIKLLCSHAKESGWSPTILGHQKRDFAREVLAAFARSTALSGLAEQYQGILRAVAGEARAMDD